MIVLPGLSSSPAWVDLLCLSLLDLCCFLLCSSCRRARLSCISSPPHPPIPPWGGVCGLRPTKALRVIRSTSDRWVAPDTHSWPPPPLLECGWLPPHCLCLLVVPGFSVLLPSCLIAPCIHYLLVLASPALISPAGVQSCRPRLVFSLPALSWPCAIDALCALVLCWPLSVPPGPTCSTLSPWSCVRNSLRLHWSLLQWLRRTHDDDDDIYIWAWAINPVTWAKQF